MTDLERKGIEAVLPEDYSLNNLIKNKREKIDCTIQDNLEGYFNDFIDYRNLTEEVDNYFRKLATILAVGGSEVEVDAIRRGILFANQVARVVYDKGYQAIIPDEYLIEDNIHRAEVIADGTQAYLSARQDVDVLIGYHMPTIARGECLIYEDRIEEACAFIFQSIERWRAEKYLDDNKLPSNLTAEDIIRGGRS